MAERPLLGIDLDDTVGDFLAGFFPWGRVEYPATKYDFRPPSEDETQRHSFEFEKAFGPAPGPEYNWLDIIHRYTIDSSLETMLPADHAVVALGNLAVEYEIHIVTSRPRIAKDVTDVWLETYIPQGLITELHMPTLETANPLRTDKGKYCKSLGMVAVIDDANHNVDQVAEAGLRAISFGDAYHSYGAFGKDDIPEGIEKAYTWKDVEGLLLPSEQES